MTDKRLYVEQRKDKGDYAVRRPNAERDGLYPGRGHTYCPTLKPGRGASCRAGQAYHQGQARSVAEALVRPGSSCVVNNRDAFRAPAAQASKVTLANSADARSHAAARKQQVDRGIFEEFARSARLTIVDGTISQPDPPDILCEIEGLGRVAFELVQLDSRTELSRMNDLQGVRAQNTGAED